MKIEPNSNQIRTKVRPKSALIPPKVRPNSDQIPTKISFSNRSNLYVPIFLYFSFGLNFEDMLCQLLHPVDIPSYDMLHTIYLPLANTKVYHYDNCNNRYVRDCSVIHSAIDVLTQMGRHLRKYT